MCYKWSIVLVISFTKVKYKCTFWHCIQISKGNSKPFDLLTSFANVFTFFSPILYQWVIYKETQKSYKKLVSTIHKEETLISTIFSISSQEQETQWIHSPKVLTNVSQSKRSSQENPYQRLSSLKFPSLISQISPSLFKFYSKHVKTWRMKPYIVHVSCQNRATISR